MSAMRDFSLAWFLNYPRSELDFFNCVIFHGRNKLFSYSKRQNFSEIFSGLQMELGIASLIWPNHLIGKLPQYISKIDIPGCT